MAYFPAFLDLRGRRTLVVGGGAVAEQKVAHLLDAGAMVQVVSPAVTQQLSQLAQQGIISLQPRRFHPRDLNEVWLVIAATNNSHINQRVAAAANRRQIFCNVVDVQRLCSFLAAANLRRGEIQIAISTSGQSPALAQRLKREIADHLTEEYAELAKIAGRLRPLVQERIKCVKRRAEIFHQLIESDVLDLLRKERYVEAEQRANDILDEAIQSNEFVGIRNSAG